jgi:hypothetical protein
MDAVDFQEHARSDEFRASVRCSAEDRANGVFELLAGFIGGAAPVIAQGVRHPDDVVHGVPYKLALLPISIPEVAADAHTAIAGIVRRELENALGRSW